MDSRRKVAAVRQEKQNPNVLNIAAGRQIFRTIIVKKGGAR